MGNDVLPAATTFSNMNQIQIVNHDLNNPVNYENVLGITAEPINPGYDTPEIGKA